METTYRCGEYPWHMNVSLNDEGNIILLDMPKWSNFHAHLRSGGLMETVAYDIMRTVIYLLVMPNTGPIRTIDDVRQYHNALTQLRKRHGLNVEFIMTLYFTPDLSPTVIEEASKLGFRVEVKYYPPEQGATTGSGFGMPLHEGNETLYAMQECGVPLLLHGEAVTDKHGNVLPHEKREREFYERIYPPFREQHPDLYVSLEHITTQYTADLLQTDLSGKTVCTITPHHLLLIMNELLERSWRNHGRCMPYLKTEEDRMALREFAFSGDPRAIAGDDTAPHPSEKKTGGHEMPKRPRNVRDVSFEEAACGCWLPHSVSLYALVAKECGALHENFVKFMCLNGASWRGLSLPEVPERLRIVATDSHSSLRDIPDPVTISGSKPTDVVVPLGWTKENDKLKVGHTLYNS